MNRLRDWIGEAKRIVFFGGAGVSTESGIPDFRSDRGLYSQNWLYPPETVLSSSFFFSHTAEFYDYYREKLLPYGARPNRAHEALAALEERGVLTAVVTQNIDGLHQAAGSRTVLELHGSVLRNHCLSCRRFYGVETIAESAGIPRCVCGGLIKPDVVLYGEPLGEEVFSRAAGEIEKADLLIVGGTSLSVYPAAGLVSPAKGRRLVLINRTPTPLDRRADLVMVGSIGKLLGDAVFDGGRPL